MKNREEEEGGPICNMKSAGSQTGSSKHSETNVMNVDTHLFQVPLLLRRHEGAAIVDLLKADAADCSAMLAAEELHQLVVVRADALQQVAYRLTQLVDTKFRIFPVRPQVLLTERGHAGEAGLRRFCLHTCITAYDILFLLGFTLLYDQAGLTLCRPLVEGLHDGAEDRVFLQLRFGIEDGPALRTAVRCVIPRV